MYSSDKTLCVLPMYHCFAWTVSVACPLLHGCCIVVQENYTLAEALRLIQRYEITQFAGVPTMIRCLKRVPTAGSWHQYDFLSVVVLPYRKSWQKILRKIWKARTGGYGLSELRRSVLLIRLKNQGRINWTAAAECKS